MIASSGLKAFSKSKVAIKIGRKGDETMAGKGQTLSHVMR